MNSCHQSKIANTPHQHRGFTLLETLITMMVIAVGLLATGKLLISSMHHNSASEQRMDASAVRQALLHEAAAKINSDADCAAIATLVSQGVRSYQGLPYQTSISCSIDPQRSAYYVLQATSSNAASNQIRTSQMIHAALPPGN